MSDCQTLSAEAAGALPPPLFSFTIPGDPVPWARARGGEEFGGFYTPQRQRTFKRNVQDFCRVAMLQAKPRAFTRPLPAGVPVLLSVRVFTAVPQSWAKSKPDLFAWAMAGGRNLERPDLDNWIKLPMDAMSRMAYADDGQVCGFPLSGKWFDHRRPRLEVDVRALGPIEEKGPAGVR